jgi:hypothetical protein
VASGANANLEIAPVSAAAILMQALGVAYAAGISVSATVALLGLVQHLGVVGTLPGGLGLLASWWIIGLALVMYSIEFLATLVPGVSSVWETVQTVVRPPAAAVLSLATVLHLGPAYVIAAALLGGTLAFTTHGTKLGLRYAVDASPEPVTNFAANVAELTTVASVCVAVWRHPYVTLGVAIALLVLLLLLLRSLLRSVKAIFRLHPRPALRRDGGTTK